MARKSSAFLGTWDILEMEEFDREYLNLVTQAYIEFEGDGSGRFQFGAAVGFLDYELETQDDEPCVEFSWEGSDELTPICGRGWAVLNQDTLNGRLFMHMGDDLGFTAKRRTPRHK